MKEKNQEILSTSRTTVLKHDGLLSTKKVLDWHEVILLGIKDFKHANAFNVYVLHDDSRLRGYKHQMFSWRHIFFLEN